MQMNENKGRRPSRLAKQLQEAPEPRSAQHGDGEVVVPAEEIRRLARAGHEARPQTHGAQRRRARDRALCLAPAEQPARLRRQGQAALERERVVGGVERRVD
ncbi:hypothetical protein LTR16_008497, partial [Cryomyces antarcticus]